MNGNLNSLKNTITKLNLHYFLLPNSDKFGSEYLPEYAKRLQFITGFTGSNAFAIIGCSKNKSAFFTDGRYTLQAAAEVDKKAFEIYNLAEKSPLNWLLENSQKNSKIGFDPSLHNISSVFNYQKYFGDNLIALETNPVDSIWKNQPEAPNSKVFKHLEKYSGLSSKEKIQKIIIDLDKNSDAVILTNPASVCWLLNIRAADVEYSPLLLSYAIVYKNNQSRIGFATPTLGSFQFLKDMIIGSPLQMPNNSVQIDFNQTNYQIYSLLKSQNITIINKPDPCLIHKAIKNPTEIKNAILAHKIDGLAVTKFLFWLENSLAKKQKIDEISATKKLLEFRKSNKKFLYESFATIAGFASNGAIVHYHSTKKTNKVLKGNGLFLIDSGGQYQEGTTDITRTIAIGTPTTEMIENFTRVLKGHIAIARAKIPQGTTGNNLDILARYHLWQAGLDYDHGTGHGVGSFSSVHESPPSISKRSDGVALQAGMILSNEPGYYKTGEYGIRIENLILVEKFDNAQVSIYNDDLMFASKLKKNEPEILVANPEPLQKNFLHFKTLTLAPIDPKLINFKMLTYPEKKWLHEYHLRVYEELKKGLNIDERTWLEKIIEPYQTK